MFKDIIVTNEEKCVGCNKCIAVCPINANDAKIVDDNNKIATHPERCIQCGKCIGICDHNARSFVDDTEEFFRQLELGTSLTVIAAPAVRYNFHNYKKLFGFLKQKGVQLIYDVSFGADITVWAYLKAIEKNRITSMIAQPCPIVVSYIQNHVPELIPYLAPIHSPALCTAIYLNKYKDNKNKIAFLSPCIGKGMEFQDPNTGGEVTYNVTFYKLNEYLQDKGIDLSSYKESDFDDMDCAMGFAFSRPGGLRENIEFYTNGSVWVKQVEGLENLCEYLDQYKRRVTNQKPVPLLIDVLNCTHGCNLGTAANHIYDIDDIDYRTNDQKNTMLASNSNPHSYPLYNQFDSMLRLDDFTRNYENFYKESFSVEQHSLEEIYQTLGKQTEYDRKINCFACGYGSCEKFARAVANHHNHVENCIYYARNKLTNSADEFDSLFDNIQTNIKKINDDLDKFASTSKSLQNIAKHTKIIAINASIESAHAGTFGKSFAIVASEMKDLAEKSADVINSNQKNEETISKEILELEKTLHEMKKEMHIILE